MLCDKGCCEVGAILAKAFELRDNPDDNYNYNSEHMFADGRFDDELQQYPAFNEMIDSWAHPNYMLTGYCIDIGHMECLLQLSKGPYFMSHASDISDEMLHLLSRTDVTDSEKVCIMKSELLHDGEKEKETEKLVG